MPERPAAAAVNEPSFSQLTEAITASVLRAVASREEFRKGLAREDAVLVWEPHIRFGGRLVLGRGELGKVLGQQQFDVQG